jgi:hypothetical protein
MEGGDLREIVEHSLAAFRRLSLRVSSPAALRLGKDAKRICTARFSGLICRWLQPDAKALDGKHAEACFCDDVARYPALKALVYEPPEGKPSEDG